MALFSNVNTGDVRYLFLSFNVNMALRSKYPNVEIPEEVSWPEFVFEAFEEYGNRTAIVSLSYLWLLTSLLIAPLCCDKKC